MSERACGPSLRESGNWITTLRQHGRHCRPRGRSRRTGGKRAAHRSTAFVTINFVPSWFHRSQPARTTEARFRRHSPHSKPRSAIEGSVKKTEARTDRLRPQNSAIGRFRAYRETNERATVTVIDPASARNHRHPRRTSRRSILPTPLQSDLCSRNGSRMFRQPSTRTT